VNLPINDDELDVIVRQLWKSRKQTGEPAVAPLYEKIKEFRDANKGG